MAVWHTAENALVLKTFHSALFVNQVQHKQLSCCIENEEIAQRLFYWSSDFSEVAFQFLFFKTTTHH